MNLWTLRTIRKNPVSVEHLYLIDLQKVQHKNFFFFRLEILEFKETQLENLK